MKIFKKIVEDFDTIFKNFSIKNLGIKTLYNLKIKIEKNIFFLEKICSIKQIKERHFLLEFKNNLILKKILKNNFFENLGFQIINKKINLELIIPNLSLEFRKKILNIIKNEYIEKKNLIEINRKKIFLILKKNKNINESNQLEKILNKEINLNKINLKKIFEQISLKILNE